MNTTNVTTTLVPTNPPTPPTLPPFFTSSAYLGTNLFLACICAVLIGVCCIGLLRNIMMKRWAQTACISLIIAFEIRKYQRHSLFVLLLMLKQLDTLFILPPRCTGIQRLLLDMDPCCLLGLHWDRSCSSQ